MGRLVEGVWQDEQHAERTPGGRFMRATTRFRSYDRGRQSRPDRRRRLCRGARPLSPHAVPCPWAHRTLIMRMLKGLEDLDLGLDRGAALRSARLAVRRRSRHPGQRQRRKRARRDLPARRSEIHRPGERAGAVGQGPPHHRQ